MKRSILAAMLACIILTASALSSFAGTKDYYIEDAGLSVEIPDTFSVVTRDTPADDPVLAEIGLDRDTMVEYLEVDNYYLEAWPESRKVYITLSVFEADTPDFSEFSDADFEAYAEDCIEYGKEYGTTYYRHEKYEHPQTVFLTFSGSYSEPDEYFILFDTVYDGKEILIRLLGSEPFSSHLENTIKDVVDSTVFNEKADKGISANRSWFFLIVASAAVVPVAVIMIFSHKKANESGEDVPHHGDPDGGLTS